MAKEEDLVVLMCVRYGHKSPLKIVKKDKVPKNLELEINLEKEFWSSKGGLIPDGGKIGSSECGVSSTTIEKAPHFRIIGVYDGTNVRHVMSMLLAVNKALAWKEISLPIKK